MSIPVPSIHSPPHSDPVWLRLHWRCICLPQPVSRSTHLHFSKHLVICLPGLSTGNRLTQSCTHTFTESHPACSTELWERIRGRTSEWTTMSQQKVLQHVFFFNKLLAQCHRWKKEGANNCEKQKNPKTQELWFRSYCTGHWEIKREKTEREKRRRLWRDVIALVKRGCDRRWPQQWGDS